MSPLFLFVFITISLLILACFASGPNGNNQYKTETFGNNDFPDFGRPIHLILPTPCRKAYISYQAPSGHGQLGCTQVPCPPKTFEHLPEDIKASMPPGFQSNVTCWSCCNYDDSSDSHTSHINKY